MQTETVAGFRLSPQQEQLWQDQQDDPGYRVSALVSIEGRLDVPALRAALADVVARHEALRTTFTRRPGMKVPFQVVREDLAPSWTEVAGGNVVATIAEHARRPFDFERGPLVRAILFTLHDTRHVLALSLSSLIADAASLANVIRETVLAYAERRGDLAEDPIQYADFSEWEHEVLAAADEDAAQAKAFWQDLASRPAPQIPFEVRAPAEGTMDLGAVPVAIDASAMGALAAPASAGGPVEGASPEAIGLFTAFQILVTRYSLEADFALGFHLDGRGQEEVRCAVGLYAKIAPLTISLEDNPRFSEAVKRTRDAVEAASRWKDYLRPLGLGATSVMFEMHERIEPLEAGGAVFSPGEISATIARFSLKLSVHRSAGAVEAILLHDRRVLRDEDAARLARSLEILIEGAAKHPEVEAFKIPILTAEDKEKIISFSEASGDFSNDACFHHLFEDQARRTPSMPALVCGDRSLTYADLDRRANQVAHRLERCGVTADTRVGLSVERSAEMIIGLLGILKAGGAYVPLLADHPRQRLAHQLAEVEAPVILTLEKHLSAFPDFGGQVICLDRDSAQLDAEPTTAPARRGGPDSLAYVIYTSGSTGVPKGVLVTHRNVVNYTEALRRRLGITPGQEGLHFATVSTIAADLGNTCVFPALASGGCLHVIRHEVSMDGGLFAAYGEEHPIDVLKITPSHLNALIAAAGPDRSVLPRRFLITGGEASSWDLSRRIRAGGCVHLNHYGPTETTIGSLTYGPVTDADPAARFSRTIPIGRPLANTEIHIVDANMAPVPIGAPGELLIGGAGLARGYIQQPEQTAQRFIKNPFSSDPASRLYRTGDRARFLPDGSVEFLGRVDDQVKIRGFRVEPAEIEGVLRKDPAIRQAVVVAREDAAGDLRLVAYFVPTKKPAPGVEEIRASLQRDLPEYMIPSIFVPLAAMPLTPNGKIDRRALPAPDQARRPENTFLAPSTPTEEKVAAIWAAVLRVDRVGVNDNFFELGGHSLLATQVISRAQKEFELFDLRLGSLFDRPSVLGMAKVIDDLLAAKSAEMDRMLALLNNMTEEEAERLARQE